jgi:ABC-type nitrate/sulfonate/bicarbonate transport system substrate-binding protein
VIGRLSEGIAHFQTNALVTRRSWAEKNRPLMVRFMKAMVLTFRWMFENRDATVEFLSKEMQLKPVHARKGVGILYAESLLAAGR